MLAIHVCDDMCSSMPMSPLTSDESDTSPGYVYPPGIRIVDAIHIVDDEPEREPEIIEVLDEEQDRPIPPWRKPQPLVPPPAKRQATVANANCQWVTQKMVDDFCCKLKPEARAAFMALYPRDQRLLLALCVENRADLIKDRNTHAFVCSWAAQRMRSGKQW